MKNSNFSRKLFTVAAVVMMSVAFYSCKGKEAQPSETDVNVTTEETTAPAETSTTTTQTDTTGTSTDSTTVTP